MQFKFPINTIAISLTVILLVNVEISAQKWNINIGYANTVPAVDPKVENFHGLDLSLESVVFSRIKAKINFSSFVRVKGSAKVLINLALRIKTLYLQAYLHLSIS